MTASVTPIRVPLKSLTRDEEAGELPPEAFDTEERLPHGAGFFLAVPLGVLVWAVIGGCFWLIASGTL